MIGKTHLPTYFHFVNWLVSGPKDIEHDDVISIRKGEKIKLIKEGTDVFWRGRVFAQ